MWFLINYTAKHSDFHDIIISNEFLNVLFNFTLSENGLIIEHAFWVFFNIIGEKDVKGLSKKENKSIKDIVLKKVPKLIQRTKDIIMDSNKSKSSKSSNSSKTNKLIITDEADQNDDYSLKLITLWLISNIIQGSNKIIKEVTI